MALVVWAFPALSRAEETSEAVVPLPALATAVRLDPAADAPPLTLRIGWGGGRHRRWDAAIRIVDAAGAAVTPLGWRALSADGTDAARVFMRDGRLVVHRAMEGASDEIELEVADDPAARIAVRLVPDGRDDQAYDFECTVGEVILGEFSQPVDGEANRLVIRRAPGDEIRVAIDGGRVHLPGETVRLRLHPLLASRDGGAATYELRVRVREGADGPDTYSHTWLLHEAKARPGDRPDAPPQRFEPISIEVPLPAREAAWDVSMEVFERGGLRWARPLASRVVQVASVSASPPRQQPEGEWRALYELDPTSPKLLERLRRLLVVGRGAAGSLPHVPLPMMSMPKLPSVPLPAVPLPSMPVPKLPSVGTVVPRLTGLLAAGHSMLESHPAGAVFRLPPARSEEEPSWEAIHLSGAVAGAPHRVEIRLPAADRQTVAVTVLEQVGSTVIATFQGGFSVEGAPGSAAMETHACTFWPLSRAPLVVIGNASLERPVSFGSVRVLVGPTRLRPTPIAARAPGRRAVWGVIDTPGLAGFGGPLRVEAATGRAVADWRTLLGAARTSAEWFAAQGAAGAMITVRSGSESTGAVGTRPADAALDPAPEDAIEVLCRVYGRQGLGIVPAIRCSGTLDSLEAAFAPGAAAPAGLVCVGRDGRPPRGEASLDTPRYNLLDPRVQAAVETLVADLARRVAGHAAVDGIALEVPHDGWFHLPGVAWGLDDATFARFLAETPTAAARVAAAGPAAASADETRYALRAALVEGDLREAWLAWRSTVVAEFVGRLAARVTAASPSRSLSIVPTTLFTEGDLAARFRSVFAAVDRTGDLCREIALDPALLTAHDGVVWVSPHVHVATDDLVEGESIRAANRSAAAAAPSARRRAVVAVEIPAAIDLGGVLAQGPFAATATADVAGVHAVRTGVDRERAHAESFAAGDCERIYDASLVWRAVDAVDLGRARMLESLPVGRLETVPGVPGPLVVRIGTGDAGTGVQVTNASALPCRLLFAAGQGDAGAEGDATAARAAPEGGVALDLGPWQSRALGGISAADLRGLRVAFDPGLPERIDQELARLRRRRAALEMPAPLPILDNPSFEHPENTGAVPGWELLEANRGRLRIVAGAPAGAGRALELGSDNGLATLRSNPFPPPHTGRISVAMWLRVDPGQAPPPLRIAVEGVERGREYYRFAPVGIGPGARPLSAAWAQYVLQIDDLPTHGLETLRVRLDLLAGGAVQIDDVRVFDLAFDESQRARLSRVLDGVEQHRAAGDLGAAAIALDGAWVRFLDAFVTDEAVERAIQARAAAETAGDAGTGPAPTTGAAAETARGGILDRVRRWWK